VIIVFAMFATAFVLVASVARKACTSPLIKPCAAIGPDALMPAANCSVHGEESGFEIDHAVLP